MTLVASFIMDHGVMKPHLKLLLGLCVTFVGLALTAVGLMIQKLAMIHQRQEEQDEREGRMERRTCELGCPRAYYCSRLWMMGMGVFCLGNLLFWSVLALVPQVVLACWQCWAMVVTIFASPILLGESLTCFKLTSTFVIIVGVIWVVVASPSHYKSFSIDAFWASLTEPSFLMITAGSGLLLVALLASFYCWDKPGTKSAGLRYIIVADIINWYSVLSARCSSAFFITTVFDDKPQTATWEFWGLLGAMLTLACMNVHYLNKALEHTEAMFVVPVYESFAIIGQLIFGIVFFKEFIGLLFWEKVQLGLGVCIVLGGIIMSSIEVPKTVPMLSMVVMADQNGSVGCCGRTCMSRRDFGKCIGARHPDADADEETQDLNPPQQPKYS
jgi:drug/metabolite transporter (DMT)-like permease